MTDRLSRRVIWSVAILLPALFLTARSTFAEETGRIEFAGAGLLDVERARHAETEQTGRIQGRLVLRPAFPVAPAGAPNACGIPGRIEVLDRQGTIVAQANANADGLFLIDLPPGTYILRLSRPALIGPRIPVPPFKCMAPEAGEEFRAAHEDLLVIQRRPA